VLHLSHPTHFFEPSSHQGVTFSQWSCSVFDRQRRDHRFSDLLIQRASEPDSFRPIGEGGRALHSRQVPSDSDGGIYLGDSFSVSQREGIPNSWTDYPVLQEPDRSSNRSTPKTGTGPEPEKNRIKKPVPKNT
jgi:hypothetical protein